MSQAGLIDIEQAHPQIATQFDAMTGSAIPIANVLVIDGAVVANGTYASPVYTTGSGNTIVTNVQVASAITGAPADKNDAGLVSFSDAQFTVDANGYVELIGGTASILTLTGDDSVAVSPDGAGNIDIAGIIVANATNSKPIYFDGNTVANTIQCQVQLASATPQPIDTTVAGLCCFDQDTFVVDEFGYVTLKSGSGPVVDTQTGDDGVNVYPDSSGNFKWLGQTVANATHAKPIYFKDSATANAIDLDVQVASAITGAPGDKNDSGLVSLDDENFTCDTDGYTALINGQNVIFIGKHGDDSRDGLNFEAAKLTLGGALSAASSGDVIIIYPGTYTQDVTLKDGVNIFAHSNGNQASQVIIVGKLSASFAGSCELNGLYLKTNSDYALDITGSNATVVYLRDCYLEATDNAFCRNSSSSSSSEINIHSCGGTHLGNYAFFTSSSPGGISIRHSEITQGSLTTTNCTFSAGPITIQYSRIGCLFTTSSTGFINWGNSQVGIIDQTIATINSTGTASNIQNGFLNSQSASAISIGANSTLQITNSTIDSNNATAIAVNATGTLIYNNLTMRGTSSVMTSGTQTSETYNQVGKYSAKNQPCFEAYKSSASAGIAKSAYYTVILDTEEVDQGSNYNNATGIFTAPETGNYLFTCGADISGLNSATRYEGRLTTTTRSYNLWRVNPTNTLPSGSGTCGHSGSVIVPMTAGDTAKLEIIVDGGTSTFTLQGNTNPGTHFSGMKVT